MKSSATLKALSLATVLIYLHDCMNLSVETCLVSGYEASQPVSFRSIRQVVPASHEIRTVGTACLYFKTSIQGYKDVPALQALACIIGTACLFSFSDMLSIISCQCQSL